jgi:hypothetical protein
MTISRRALYLASIASLASLLTGCAGARGGSSIRDAWSSATFGRDFTLSRSARTDTSSGITLIRVRPDGATTIRVSSKSGMLTARSGGYYVCEEFGQHGLQLVASSPEAGTATFLQMSAQ